MAEYRLMHGVEHEEDNSVSARIVWPIDYGPTFDDALHSLSEHIEHQGHKLERVDGGMFKHLPGTEGVFKEIDCNKRQTINIWLIRLLTA